MSFRFVLSLFSITNCSLLSGVVQGCNVEPFKRSKNALLNWVLGNSIYQGLGTYILSQKGFLTGDTCIIKFCMKITFIHAIIATQIRLREWIQNRMGSSCPPFARGATNCPMGTLSLCTLRSEMIFDRSFLRDRSCPTTLLTLQKFWSTLLQRCATLLQRCYRSSSVALPSPTDY